MCCLGSSGRAPACNTAWPTPTISAFPKIAMKPRPSSPPHEHEHPKADRGCGSYPQPSPTHRQKDGDGAGGQCDREDEAAEMKSESLFVVAVQISNLMYIIKLTSDSSHVLESQLRSSQAQLVS